VRWTLPLALVVAAGVAVLGLGGTLLGPAGPPDPPTVALDLTGPSSVPPPAPASAPAP
jgi:hypothetical protein